MGVSLTVFDSAKAHNDRSTDETGEDIAVRWILWLHNYGYVLHKGACCVLPNPGSTSSG